VIQLHFKGDAFLNISIGGHFPDVRFHPSSQSKTFSICCPTLIGFYGSDSSPALCFMSLQEYHENTGWTQQENVFSFYIQDLVLHSMAALIISLE